MSSIDKARKRATTRLYAVQALFQMEASATSLRDVVNEFMAHRFGQDLEEGQFEDGDPAQFRKLVEAAVNWQAKIDQLTDQALVAKWPIARIDPTLRALFRAAGAELVEKLAPPKVVISEYVTLADAFYPGGQERRFVNAVLDHMARDAVPEAFKPRD